MLNVVQDTHSYDPSSKHAYFEEAGVTFEVRFTVGIGYPGSVKALHPYEHLGMIDWGDESRARELARTYLAARSTH